MFRDRTCLPTAEYTVTHVRYPTYQNPHSGLHSFADSVHPLTRAAAKVTVATTVDTRQSRSHCSTGPTLQYAINNIYRTFADKRLRNDKACCCCSGRVGVAAARSSASRPSLRCRMTWTLALLSLWTSDKSLK